jgi:subtilase family serine protease
VTSRHVGYRRFLAFAVTALTGAALTVGGPSAAAMPAAPSAAAAPVVQTRTTPTVTIHPMLRRRFARASKPLTTAMCRTRFHFPCYGPTQLQQAYDLTPLYRHGITGHGETIVIVDAFGSSTIRHDLAVFDQHYSLPAPPSLRVIAPAGKNPPGNHAGWAGETTLDVEWAHSMAPGARILLVHTPKNENEGTSGFPQIVKAENYVVRHHLGAVISQSFGATENTFPSRHSLIRLRSAYRHAAAHHVSVLAATGDTGAADVTKANNYFLHPVTDWPASDPLVTAVGGTRLALDAQGSHNKPDQVWNDSMNRAVARFFGVTVPDPDAGGGGSSIVFHRPAYQNSVGARVGSQRGLPDISMSAACNGQVETYQSFPGQRKGWYLACGTSEATPLLAGIVALADQAVGHHIGLINPSLYRLAAAHRPGIVDVTRGSTTVRVKRRGKEHTIHGAHARRGYDEASGVGTIDGAKLVHELVAAG